MRACTGRVWVRREEMEGPARRQINAADNASPDTGRCGIGSDGTRDSSAMNAIANLVALRGPTTASRRLRSS